MDKTTIHDIWQELVEGLPCCSVKYNIQPGNGLDGDYELSIIRFTVNGHPYKMTLDIDTYREPHHKVIP